MASSSDKGKSIRQPKLVLLKDLDNPASGEVDRFLAIKPFIGSIRLLSSNGGQVLPRLT